MAFDVGDKLKIIQLLGWSAHVINPDSIYYNNILNNRLMVLVPEAEEMALEMVTNIQEIDVKIDGAVDSSGIKRFDEIEFFGSRESGTKIYELRKERNTLIKELSDLLDIPRKHGGNMGSVSI